MIVDCHTHIFPPEFVAQREKLARACRYFGLLYGNPKRRMASAEQLLASMKRTGIDRAVAFGFPWTDSGRRRAANDYVLDAAARSAGRIIPFAVVDPADLAFTEGEVERLADRGLRGLGELMPDGQGFRMEDECTTDALMRLAASRDLVVMVHVSEPVGHDYPGKGHVRPETICRIAAKFPEARIIVAHWGGGLMAYEMMPEVAQALRNVYYDSAASSLIYDDRAFRVAAILAPKKILFATDYALLPQRRMLQRARAALADSPALHDFLGGNEKGMVIDVGSCMVI